MTVLAKLSIPVLVLPVIIWALTVAVQAVLLLLSAVVLTAHGESTALLWTQLHLGRDAIGLLYHLVALHGISTAPFYAWLLLVSAWATRAPFAWAILPPAAIMVFERVAFGTTRIAHLLIDQLGGGTSAPPPAPGATLMESMNCGAVHAAGRGAGDMGRVRGGGGVRRWRRQAASRSAQPI